MTHLRAATALLLTATVALTSACAAGSGPDSTDDTDTVEVLAPICPAAPACNTSITIAPDSPALLLRDPEVLAQLPLDDVLARVLELGGDTRTTPEELLQRIFDTSNNTDAAVFPDGIHCDSDNNLAHANGPAAFCPRTEGALAVNTGLMSPDHPDGFFPVAVVNRIDRMTGSTDCGEFRIIYAKRSGTGDPDDRVFLILEPALQNPVDGCLNNCQFVADFWQKMESRTPEERAQAVRSFFFDGLPGFSPTLHPDHLGLPNPDKPTPSGYYDGFGQMRIGQHMDAVWEYRELQLRATEEGLLRFVPVTVKNNPLPSRFAPDAFGVHDNYAFQYYFPDAAWTLAGPTLERIGMSTSNSDNAGESALGGPHINDYTLYASQSASSSFNYFVQVALDDSPVPPTCPPDDPLTVEQIYRRATTQSCAGCHSPKTFLGEERKIGCGLVWPDSLGQVHIDENGNLSPALKELFLPHRAGILSTFLQSCDEDAINRNLRGGPIGPGGVRPLHY